MCIRDRGVAVRESGMKHIYDFVSGPLLYGSTFMLGVLLGVLCDAHLLLDPKILKLLVLGIVALLLSGIGGIIGGYIMYIIKRGNYNPVIGIAAVSCVPTTAKVAQKIVSKDNPDSFVLGDALGANISGVITSAISAEYRVSTAEERQCEGLFCQRVFRCGIDGKTFVRRYAIHFR